MREFDVTEKVSLMWLIIAFLWPSPPWAEDVEKGIADMPDVREKYVAAGLSITGGAA